MLALVLAGTFLAGSAMGPTVRSALQRTPAVPAATASATPAHAVKRNEEVRLRVVPDAVLVKFEPGTPQRVMTGLFARAGVAPKTVVSDIGVRVLRVPPERREAVLALLKSSVVVEYAEREVVVEALDVVPNDPRWSSQWGPRVVSAPEAWDTTRGSRSVVVAVVDTGVNPEHPDLSGALVPGYDFVNNDADPSDDNGHGTAVAGVVAARTNNGVGEAGLCWTCSIMPIKALDANGSGSTATIPKAIVLAADNGADIINLSLGGPATTQTLTDAVDYAASKGVLIFAAAGNNGETAFFYPAAYPQVLAVAGTDEADHVYSWSNHGPWVQVSAPGCNVAPLLGGGYGDRPRRPLSFRASRGSFSRPSREPRAMRCTRRSRRPRSRWAQRSRSGGWTRPELSSPPVRRAHQRRLPSRLRARSRPIGARAPTAGPSAQDRSRSSSPLRARRSSRSDS